MISTFARSLVLNPVIEADLRGTTSRHCLYVARLITVTENPGQPPTETPLDLPYPSSVRTSIVNIGEGESFIDRWLAADKAKHTAELADYLHQAGICKPFRFRVVVDAYALQPTSQADSIELMLERCFMAACHCPPFFQEVRGGRKKLKPGKEVRLYRIDHAKISNPTDTTCQDFQHIEAHVLQFVDAPGITMWQNFKTHAHSFFQKCTTTKNDVSVSFVVDKDVGYPHFGTHIVHSVSGELPTGVGVSKHVPKVDCFKLLQGLASTLSTPQRSVKEPTSVPVGQNGQHGTLESKSSGGGFWFESKKGRKSDLDDHGHFNVSIP